MAKFPILNNERIHHVNSVLFFAYPLKISLLGRDIFSEPLIVTCVILFLCLTFVQLWRCLTRMPLAWSFIGWACLLIIFLRLSQIYLLSLGDEKIISPGDNLWLLSIIRDLVDFGDTQNSHAISGIGYSYHYGAIVHISVLAGMHDFFFEFGLIFLMPMALYLFSSLQILKITSLITSSSKGQILAMVFFTFAPITIFAGSIGELIDTVTSEPTFRYSYYLPTYYGFSLVLFLALITLRANLFLTLLLSPILLLSLYSAKPVFMIVTMPLILFLIVGRLINSPWSMINRFYFFAAIVSEMLLLFFLLPRSGLSSPYFEVHLDFGELMENPLKAQHQTISLFFLVLCFGIWYTFNHLNYLKLQILLSIILASLIAFLSTQVIVLTYSTELPSGVLTRIQSSSDNSSLLSNDSQALYLVVVLFSLLIPFFTGDKERKFGFRTTLTFVSFCILTLPIGQISNEFAVFEREKRFVSEDDFNYGPYVSSLQEIKESNSLILPNDIASSIKNFSRPASADYLSAFTNHNYYISRLGWQSFNSQSWKRVEEARKFFTTSDLGFVLDFLQEHNISHVAIHARCSKFGSSSQGAVDWSFFTPEQLLLRIETNGLPINFEKPMYGSSRCI